MIPLSALRTAAYCPRQLYYRRRDDTEPPETVDRRRALADRYSELVDADDATLSALPVEVDPATYRRRLRWLRERGHEPPDDTPPAAEEGQPCDGDADATATSDRWRSLVDPLDREVYLSGRDCHGVAHRLLGDPLRPSLVSAGAPPERGVWEPQSVWAVGAAKALSHERETRITAATVEYPAFGAVRRVHIDGRRRAAYRETVRTVESMEGVPERTANRQRCTSCEYATDCGVRTRTLSSLLGR